MNKGLKLLSDYIFYKNYSQRKDNGELETWDESLDRIYSMHRNYLLYKRKDIDFFQPLLERAKEYESRKKFLSSQRNRQWASPKFTEGTLKIPLRSYNCSSTYIDRIEVFGEIMYVALAGAGIGWSLHKGHTDKLPKVADKITITNTIYSIEDSCEGIAEAIHVLMRGIFSNGNIPTFDYGQIRPKGSLISGKFKAPGYEPTKKVIDKITEVAIGAQGRKLKSIELHTMLCTIIESVVTAGVRRGSAISLFDKDDMDMIKAKTGDWYNTNREFAMANNSVIILFGEDVPFDYYLELFESIKEYGEPGIAKFIGYDYTGNP